jgi:hypothetical protein
VGNQVKDAQGSALVSSSIPVPDVIAPQIASFGGAPTNGGSTFTVNVRGSGGAPFNDFDDALCSTIQSTDFQVTVNGAPVPATVTCTPTPPSATSSNSLSFTVAPLLFVTGETVSVTSPAGQWTDSNGNGNTATTLTTTVA